MTNIENYLNDGANWQAQCVLMYLRANIGSMDIMNIYVGRYENGREQGYIFSVRNEPLETQRNYAVYEHRNSDQLCIVRFDTELTVDTPSKQKVWDAMQDNKWNYTKAFGCGDIEQCGEYIINDMKQFLCSNQERKIKT